MSEVFRDYVNNESLDFLDEVYLLFDEKKGVIFGLYSSKKEADLFLKEINNLRGSFKISDKTFGDLKEDFIKRYSKKLKKAKEGVRFLKKYLEKLANLKDDENFSEFYEKFNRDFSDQQLYNASDYFIKEHKKSKNSESGAKKFYDLLRKLEKEAKSRGEKGAKLTPEMRKAAEERFKDKIAGFEFFVEQVSPMLEDLEKLTREELVEMLNNYKTGSFYEDKKN